ncbi:MAG: 30S ribosomal protein S18 [Verrucomicrobiae bacterium]|nr:30S ribosomal protein S18 [Verrucomicrobiae bacterium]
MITTKISQRPRRRLNRSFPKRKIDINPDALEFKNTELLKKFITEKGRILPRRVTGMPAKWHRKLNRAIKRARHVLLVK